MANTIIGKILSIGQTVNVSKQKEYLKRELILDISRKDKTSGQIYENYATINFAQKHCGDLDAFKAGDIVEVTFMLSGRKYEKEGTTKYFTDIMGYKIETYQRTSAPTAPTAQAPAPVAAEAFENNETDDLPF